MVISWLPHKGVEGKDFFFKANKAAQQPTAARVTPVDISIHFAVTYADVF